MVEKWRKFLDEGGETGSVLTDLSNALDCIDHIWKLAWVGFEPTTTEFRSDALTDGLSGHEFNSHSKLTLYSYSNFILLFIVHV